MSVMKTALRIGLSSLLLLGGILLSFSMPVAAAGPTTNCGNPLNAGEKPWSGDLPTNPESGVIYCKPVTAAQQTQAGANKSGLTDSKSLEEYIAMVINILLFVIGAVAVIMIIIGGIRYVTSNGDQAQVKGAKDTIMYSVIGLVVAILQQALCNGVIH
jgi:hypothetical protein